MTSNKFNTYVRISFLALATVVLFYDYSARNVENSIMILACLGLSSVYRIEMSVWNRVEICFCILGLASLGINGWYS